jgi:hypothetical protein
LISIPALAGNKHIQLDIKVSDIVNALGKPDFTSNYHHAFWYHKYVLVVCEIDLDDYDDCYMDKTLEELQALNVVGGINKLVYFIEKKIEERKNKTSNVEILD